MNFFGTTTEYTRYDLIPTPGGNGYYYYDGDNLTVEEGDVFQLYASYFGKRAYGNTTVPSAPANVTISSTTLPIPTELSFPPNPEDFTSQLTVNWDSIPGAVFYVTLENVEENPQEIKSPFGGGFRPPGIGGPKRFISIPRSGNEYRIGRSILTHYGRHVVNVYRINQEYADLYVSRMQDSRDINEPLSNIQHGLGVFSAFNSDSLIFTAYPE